MSTPIETNTEELQEILRTVNNLPNAGGGGFSIPVIDLAELGFTVFELGQQQSLNIDQETYDHFAPLMESGIVQLKCLYNLELYDGGTITREHTYTTTILRDVAQGNSFVDYSAHFRTERYDFYFTLWSDGWAVAVIKDSTDGE